MYTAVASSMVLQADIVVSRLATVPLGTSRRLLRITPPPGPSSNGGAQARQTLLLTSGAEHPVCGWVDFAAAVAEVKDYETTRAAYEARFRVAFDVKEAEYREWLHKLQAVLKELGVRCAVTGDAVAYAPTDPGSLPGFRPRSPQQRSSLLPVVLAVGVALAGLGLAALLLLF